MVEIFKKIGENEICPYCKNKLNKIPKRKSKCPFCGEYIFSRKRAYDNKKVLLTSNQKDEVESEWKRFHESNGDPKSIDNDEYAIAKKELTKEFKTNPSTNDIWWRVYNKRIIELTLSQDWGLLRNNKLDMVRLLDKEGKDSQSLDLLLEICYSDINGCGNNNTIDLTFAFIAPGIIKMIKEKINKLKLNNEEVKKRFIKLNKKNILIKKLPFNPEKAWVKLEKKLI